MQRSLNAGPEKEGKSVGQARRTEILIGYMKHSVSRDPNNLSQVNRKHSVCTFNGRAHAHPWSPASLPE